MAKYTIKNELQKICYTKSLLKEIKIASQSKKEEPILTSNINHMRILNKAKESQTCTQLSMLLHILIKLI